MNRATNWTPSKSGALIVAALLGLTASAQVPQPAPAPAAPKGATPSDKVRIRIGPGDLLQVNIYDEPELAQTVRVDDRGGADLLLLGNLHLSGLSTTEASNLMEKLLKERDFLLNPSVSVMIAEYQTQEVSVLGEVKKPGTYQVLGARNLLDVLSMAGGVTPYAANKVTIKRRSGEQQVVKTNLVNDPDQMLASEVQLEPGDTIIVPRGGIVYVLGEVQRPGAFVMQDDGSMSMAQAIAMAAGFSQEAAQSKARVVRKAAGGFKEQEINLKRILEGKDPDPGLQAEDIVYVPNSILKGILVRAPMLMQSAASAAVYQGVMALP